MVQNDRQSLEDASTDRRNSLSPTIPDDKPYRLFPSTRLFMFILVLIGGTALGGGFAGFNFAIVCMVNETAIDDPDRFAPSRNSSTNLQCGSTSLASDEDSMMIQNGYDGTFVWDRATQANLLAAHAFGAIAFNIPSGLFSDRYGSKLILGFSVLINGVANALSPLAAHAGVPWMFAARVLQGIGTGMAWPPMLSMVSRWGTPAETGMFVTLGALGYQLGPLISMATSGLICDSTYRWPFIFYMWATLSFFFVIIWSIFYTNHPDQCRFISKAELTYLRKYQMNKKSDNERSLWNVPWKSIITSPSVLAVNVCQFSGTWANYYVTEFMPTYSKEVLNFAVRGNGLTAALPPMLQVISRTLMGPLADRITFGGRSATFSTKTFTFVCTFIPTVAFVILGFLDCRQAAFAVALFCIATACMSLSTLGYLRAGVMVAPRYAGIVGSIGNMYADAGGIIMPYVTGAMISHGTVAEWKGTLFLVGAILGVTGVQYMLLGSAEEQGWAKSDEKMGEKKATNKVFTVEGGKVERMDVVEDGRKDRSQV